MRLLTENVLSSILFHQKTSDADSGEMEYALNVQQGGSSALMEFVIQLMIIVELGH